MVLHHTALHGSGREPWLWRIRADNPSLAEPLAHSGLTGLGAAVPGPSPTPAVSYEREDDGNGPTWTGLRRTNH